MLFDEVVLEREVAERKSVLFLFFFEVMRFGDFFQIDGNVKVFHYKYREIRTRL